MQSTILRAKEIIAKADAIIITAGAGMGVDSGMPDLEAILTFGKPIRL